MEEARNCWEWIMKRAAILEHGGLDQAQATLVAFMCWYRRFVEHQS
jgi:hypothetical protein